MNKEKQKWQVFLSATVIAGAAAGCVKPVLGNEKPEVRSLSTPAIILEPTITYEIFASPTATETITPTSTKTATLTPTKTSTSTATETLSPIPSKTNTAIPNPTPTHTPSPSETISIKENKTNVRYPIVSGNTSRPETALTIDDGYDKTSIEKMLKILKEKNIKCTFFISGQYLLSYPDLWKRAIRDGHQICNHSSTHSIDWKSWISEEKVKQEILGWENASDKIFGKEYTAKMKKEFPFIRFPYGGGNKSADILIIAEQLGYVPVWYSITPETNGGIFLLHFIPADVNRLNEVLNRLDKKGLKAVTVSELLR